MWSPEPDFADMIEHAGDCDGSLCPECGCCVHAPEKACDCLSTECQCSPNFGEAYNHIKVEGERVTMFIGPLSPDALPTEEKNQ